MLVNFLISSVFAMSSISGELICENKIGEQVTVDLTESDKGIYVKLDSPKVMLQGYMTRLDLKVATNTILKLDHGVSHKITISYENNEYILYWSIGEHTIYQCQKK